ncbi:MAG: acyltransferase [Leptonema illini]|jgi:peptidoglycan/LPS O-acetylase OafA/YrhL|uniref:Acyltransferase n=1 Tax=Leptonema illini TaxID=183 RepID=A0A833H4A3_9LEPT|nr:MAG: acyltransferase [Leptonema illini]
MNLIKQAAAYIFSPFSAAENEIRALHGLRALSILGIIVYHAWHVASNTHLTWMPEIIGRFLPNLTTTVNLFFMLSGYLITSGLLHEWKKKGSIDFRIFFLKRTFRIFPSYYILVFFMIFFVGAQIRIIEGLPEPTADQQRMLADMQATYANRIWDLLYLSNFVQGRLVEHGWTLSIEEQYYLVFPLLASLLIFRLERKHRLYFLLALYFIPLCSRLYYLYVSVTPDSAFKVYYYSHTRFDSILVGVLIAVFIHDWRDLYNRLMDHHAGKLAIASVLLYALRHLWNINEANYENALGYNFADLSYGGMILVGIHGKTWLAKALSIRPLIPVAKVSYSMYLWHMLLTGVAFSKNYRIGEPITPFLLSLITVSAIVYSFLMAWFMYVVVEAPFMKLRDRVLRRFREA